MRARTSSGKAFSSRRLGPMNQHGLMGRLLRPRGHYGDITIMPSTPPQAFVYSRERPRAQNRPDDLPDGSAAQAILRTLRRCGACVGTSQLMPQNRSTLSQRAAPPWRCARARRIRAGRLRRAQPPPRGSLHGRGSQSAAATGSCCRLLGAQ